MLGRLAQLYYDSDISPKYVERCLSKNMQGTRFFIERKPSEEVHDEAAVIYCLSCDAEESTFYSGPSDVGWLLGGAWILGWRGNLCKDCVNNTLQHVAVSPEQADKTLMAKSGTRPGLVVVDSGVA
jgi:hypothetical protein